MAKKKIEFDKLDLGTKREVRKPATPPANVPSPDVVVQQIHEAPAEPAAPKVRTKRVTLDIPQPLHAEIRKHTFDLGITMKQYFLELAKQNMGLD